MSLLSVLSNLKTSWLESLRYFLPENLKNFLLVSLKAFKEWLTVLKKHAFLLAVLIIVPIILHDLLINKFSIAPAIYFILFAAIYWLRLILLSLRSSIDLKNKQYYRNQKIISFIFLFMLFFVIWLLHNSLIFMQKPWAYLSTFFLINTYSLAFYLSPVIIFFTLFYLDSNYRTFGFFTSLWRAIKMIVYNYPFCFVIFNLFGYIIKFTYIIIEGHISPMICTYTYKFIHLNCSVIKYSLFTLLIATTILPFYCCLLTNFYIKRIHDQFKLYY